ncbi:MAG: mitochondrial fission ELM1 family protein [Gammaproteobacteria bacterium]|nr:MAG: mitochondrial fission ELM1 family protein [Gammaproteobacteria bacterium]
MPESASRAAPPRVWLLTGYKAGDNNQVLALAEALEWPFETKQFRYRAWELLSNRLPGGTLAGIDKGDSSPLAPPWPDLVITAGRRNEPVARWIRRQSRGHTRLVHVGRPWAPLECFDLIVVTPQYFLPVRDNILHVDLPLHRITRAGLDAIAHKWSGRFADLPRPWWSVLLGGDSGPFVFTPEKAARLAGWLNDAVGREGGSLLVTSSARTPDAAWAKFLDTVQVPHSAWRWGESGGENPYLAYLALADRLVVTGESMSMLAEASTTGKPLYIFDLSDCPHDQAGRCPRWWMRRRNYRFKPLSHHLAMRLAPRRMRRDVSRIQDRLVASGRAVWTGGEWKDDNLIVVDRDITSAVERVQALFVQNTSV